MEVNPLSESQNIDLELWKLRQTINIIEKKTTETHDKVDNIKNDLHDLEENVGLILDPPNLLTYLERSEIFKNNDKI
jgi:hypothetical protein